MVRMKKKRKREYYFRGYRIDRDYSGNCWCDYIVGREEKNCTSTYGITEMTNSEITQETEIFGQEISNSQSSKELDRDQTLAAIERFCREQNPDLNNMSQDEYFFYWELTSET